MKKYEKDFGNDILDEIKVNHTFVIDWWNNNFLKKNKSPIKKID